MEIFLFLYLLALIFWLTTDKHYERHVRYILPVSGVILIYFCRFLNSLMQRVVCLFSDRQHSGIILKVVLVCLIGVNVQYIGKNITFNDDDIGKTETRQLVKWLKENTEPKDHYFFYHPRVLALLTGRTGESLWTMEGARRDSPSQLLKRLKAMDVFYVILARPGDDYLIKELETGNYLAQKSFDNGRFKVYLLT